MNSGTSATYVGIIHHIIVQQCEIMEYFDAESLLHGIVDVFAAQSSVDSQQKHRAQAFAAAFQSVAHRLEKAWCRRGT